MLLLRPACQMHLRVTSLPPPLLLLLQPPGHVLLGWGSTRPQLLKWRLGQMLTWHLVQMLTWHLGVGRPWPAHH